MSLNGMHYSHTNGADVGARPPHDREIKFQEVWAAWEKAGRSRKKEEVRKLRHALVKWGERITRVDQPGSNRLDDWPYEEVAEMTGYLYTAMYEDWSLDKLTEELHRHFRQEHIE
ncbi:MAG: hypothetical protein KBD50_03590 [Candidatus Pacebacteria bacterium]|nr:hypothetical protein [Candidatus Paceibacterota bacterium]